MADITLVEGNNELNVVLTPLPVGVTNVYGTVSDSTTGLLLKDVLVTLNGYSTLTNAAGYYQFTNLVLDTDYAGESVPTTYTITFEKEGYETAVR